MSEVNPVNPLLRPVHKMFLKALKSPEHGVASTGAIAASKLMLLNTLRDPDLLRALTIAYFNPESQHNPGLRQALTYFLPVYCHSRKENAERMASVAVSVMHALWAVQDELEEEGDVEMVGLTVVGSQIVDWTDPRKLVGAEEMGGRLVTGEAQVEGLGDAHLLLAEELLEKILNSGAPSKSRCQFPLGSQLTKGTGDEKKHLISMLGKLHIHSSCSANKVQALSELVEEGLDSKTAATDSAARNAMTKLSNGLAKLSAPADKADTSGTAQEQEEPNKDDDQMTIDDDRATVDGNAKDNEEAASAVDASEAGARSDAGDAMSVVEEEDEEDTVVQKDAPPPAAAMSLEEQIQMQLQNETMDDIDEGTVLPTDDEMDIDDEVETVEKEAEAEEAEEEPEAEEEEEDDDDVTAVKEPTPPPPKRRGRKKKEPEPAPAPEPEEAAEEEAEEPTPEPKPRKRGRPPKAKAESSSTPAKPAARASTKRGSGGSSTMAAAGGSGSGSGTGTNRARGRPRKTTKDVVDELLDSDDE